VAKKHKVSKQVVDDAMQMAKIVQKPKQSKEQTKLIAQGIQKGIEEYKKRHKEKSRSLDKQKKQLQKDLSVEQPEQVSDTQIIYRQSKLGWVLLGISWVGFISYIGYSMLSA